MLGGRRLRYRVRELAVPAGSRRVLGLDWGSASSGNVEVLVAEHYGFRLERTVVADEDGRRCDLLLALDISGGWVRRFGVHRPAAFAFWATRPGPGEPDPPLGRSLLRKCPLPSPKTPWPLPRPPCCQNRRIRLPPRQPHTRPKNPVPLQASRSMLP